MISIEKSGAILIGLPPHFIPSFSFAALNIPSLFCMFSVLIINWEFFDFGLVLVFCLVYLMMFLKLLVPS